MPGPLVILLIGIVVVVGMIIVLRVNAFIALITAAMVVSLLSAGELGEKISRVAEAFGSSAGQIGIVIAMAAVIGKCLMDSGAADRIVRSFLKVLGEKNANVALMGSGFVLAVPAIMNMIWYSSWIQWHFGANTGPTSRPQLFWEKAKPQLAARPNTSGKRAIKKWRTRTLMGCPSRRGRRSCRCR